MSSGVAQESLSQSANDKKADKKARRAEKVKQKGEVTADSPHQVEAPKKPDLSKAERRAIQEAQRQAKENKTKKPDAHTPPVVKLADRSVPKLTVVTSEETGKLKKDVAPTKKSVRFSEQPTSSLLPLIHLVKSKPETGVSQVSSGIHPLILKLGIQYKDGILCGSNARSVALLCALKQVIKDYRTPPQKELSRDLSEMLNGYYKHLNECRPLSVGMLTIRKYLTARINESSEPEDQAKNNLCGALDKFFEERIHQSGQEIAIIACEKICDGDVIVTYGHSRTVLKVLRTACKKHKQFSVVVVDARPKCEGKEMVRKLLVKCPGLKCTYILMNGLSYIMPKVTKVLVGAHAVLANGYVMSRVGTSQLALMAQAYNVPVLVCCETYKFSDRMQTDSFVHNELGDKEHIVHIGSQDGPLKSCEDNKYLQIVSLLYDVTPSDYITGLITEAGLIPSTSAPVVIRVKQQFED